MKDDTRETIKELTALINSRNTMNVNVLSIEDSKAVVAYSKITNSHKI